MGDVSVTISLDMSRRLKLAKLCPGSEAQADTAPSSVGQGRWVGVDGLSRRFSISSSAWYCDIRLFPFKINDD